MKRHSYCPERCSCEDECAVTSAIADEREVSAIEIKRLRDALKTLVDDCLQYDAWARPVYAVEKAQHVLSGKE